MQSHTSLSLFFCFSVTLSVSESSDSTPAVWFGALLSYLHLFTFFISSSSPSCFFVLPYPLTLSCPNACLPSCLPACQRVQKAAKIKKKAVCNKQSKMETLKPLSLLSHLFFFVSLVPVSVSVASSILVLHISMFVP